MSRGFDINILTLTMVNSSVTQILQKYSRFYQILSSYKHA